MCCLSGLQVECLVNEAHYFNDAVLMMPIWPQPASDPLANKHGLSSQTHARQSHMYALQPAQEKTQAGNQSQGSSSMLQGYCDAIVACDNDVTQITGQFRESITTGHMYTTPTPQVPSLLSASSNGLLIAQRLWQEVLTVSAGLAAQ